MHRCDDTAAVEKLVRKEFRQPLGVFCLHCGRRLVHPDELRVGVGQARSGEPTFVHDRKQFPVRLRGPALLPRLGDQRNLIVVQLGERADVVGCVNDHLLALEGRIEVRDDTDPPRIAEHKRLGRSPVFAAGAERARLELPLGRRLDLGKPGAGSSTSARGKEHLTAGERILPDAGQLLLLPPPADSRNGLKSSIGSGRMIVDERSELISSIVCRKRSCSDIGFSDSVIAASLSRSEAWNSPSALMTLARRSRSASAWRAIARCMPWGMPTSLISTVVTFTPHGSVCSSMICCRFSLRVSRSARSVSRSALPSTERSVVCAICDVAARIRSTSTTDLTGSMTRK